jgi:hypothetical protein
MLPLIRAVLMLFLLVSPSAAFAECNIEWFVSYLNSVLPVQWIEPTVGKVTMLDAAGIEPRTVVVRFRLEDVTRAPLTIRELADFKRHAVQEHCSNDEMKQFDMIYIQRWLDSTDRPIGVLRYSNQDCK